MVLLLEMDDWLSWYVLQGRNHVANIKFKMRAKKRDLF